MSPNRWLATALLAASPLAIAQTTTPVEPAGQTQQVQPWKSIPTRRSGLPSGNPSASN